ncbi:MAG: hypothetical protein ACP5US_12185 [Candidatus Kryptoniota bacterium]
MNRALALLLGSALVLAGCSKSTTSTNSVYITANNLLPLSIGNWWNYTESDINASGQLTGQPRNVMTRVVGDTTMDGYTGVFYIVDSTYYSKDSISVTPTFFRKVTNTHLEVKLPIKFAGLTLPPFWGTYFDGSVPLGTVYTIKDTTVSFAGQTVPISVKGVVTKSDSNITLINGSVYSSPYKLTIDILIGPTAKLEITNYLVDGVGPVRWVNEFYLNGSFASGYRRDLIAYKTNP